MGGRDRSHHVDPRPPDNGVVGGWDVQDAELYDDIEWIGADREFNHAGRMCLVLVEFVEK